MIHILKALEIGSWKMQENVEIVTNHKSQYWTKIPQNRYCDAWNAKRKSASSVTILIHILIVWIGLWCYSFKFFFVCHFNFHLECHFDCQPPFINNIAFRGGYQILVLSISTSFYVLAIFFIYKGQSFAGWQASD